ncbi:MAG: lysylphosphatidylglycerol synthase transmembrane domain-containing protein [Polyangiales bacterium]
MTPRPESVPPDTLILGAPESLIRRHWLKLVVSIAIAVVFGWTMHKAKLPLAPSAAQLAQVKWSWVAVHFALLVSVHTIRAVRWRHLLRPIAPEVATRRVLAASWIGFAAILLLPLRAGEVVRPYLARDGKKVSFAAALGTIGAERVIDGLVVTLALAGALVFVPRLPVLPDHVGDLAIPVSLVPRFGFLALFVFVAAFVAMALFFFAHGFALKLMHATIGRVSQPVADKLSRIVDGVASGLHFLAGPRYALPFLFETAVYWTLNAVGMLVLGYACGLDMHLGHAFAVMGVLAVGILVPAGPGLIGPFQASTYAALAMYFDPHTVVAQGAVYVFLLYTVQFVWHLVAAAIAGALDPALVRRAVAPLERPVG